MLQVHGFIFKNNITINFDSLSHKLWFSPAHEIYVYGLSKKENIYMEQRYHRLLIHTENIYVN